MHKLIELFSFLYNVKGLVQTVGYAGLALIIFTETGLLFGFFLPGDSLLFTAGLACAPGNALGVTNLDIVTLNLCLIPAAIVGDALGFGIGRVFGMALYKREKTFFFRKDHLMKTKAFYEKHGGKTIVMARFIPIVRTFAPVVAGIGQMPYTTFAAFNIFGGIGWVAGLSVLGYYLGSVEWIRKNLELTIMLVIFISLLPAIIAFIQAKFFDKTPATSAGAPAAPATTDPNQA